MKVILVDKGLNTLKGAGIKRVENTCMIILLCFFIKEPHVMSIGNSS